MTAKRLNILVIEDNPADVRLLEKMLADWPYDIESVGRLELGLASLKEKQIDLVLLDLSLPDSQGINTFYELHLHAPHVPVIVLTGLEDESIGSEAVQLGAQDYLVKGQVLPGLLGRSIKYAIERHQSESKMKELNDSLEKRVIQLATANQELHKLGKALALSCEHALQASRSKSQFVARISHDIRSPISAVLGITDLLLSDNGSRDPAETQRLIRLIDDSARSQLSLLTEILDFSKVEAGKVQLSDVDFSPVALLEDAAELFAASAAKKGVSLMTYIDYELKPALHGDPSLLREVLINLTNNAIKFTAKGDVVLQATKEAEEDGVVTVKFAITDSGIGMSSEDRELLFKPFSQLQPQYGTEYGSSGLGLSICKGLVDLMGGQIGVDSAPGKGSTFWFKLKLKRPASANILMADDSTMAPVSHSSTKREINGLPEVRVLIVDGNETEREILRKYVVHEGWLASGSAGSADEAMEMLTHAEATGEPYDVAVIELQSCQKDSFALARMIDADPHLASTKLIYLTAVDQRIKGEEAWAAGFAAYLTRPIKQANLIDCIAGLAAGTLNFESMASNVSGLSATTAPASSGSSANADTIVGNSAGSVASPTSGSTTSSVTGSVASSTASSTACSTGSTTAKDGMTTSLTNRLSSVSSTSGAVADAPAASGGASRRATADGARVKSRVLVVEDNPVMRTLLVLQLEKLGVESDAVANGAEAVTAVKSRTYALVLMDCQMPEMTGLEATVLIRKLGGAAGLTPIVAVTSGAPGQSQKECLDAGMNEYLLKPLPAEALRTLLARWSVVEAES